LGIVLSMKLRRSSNKLSKPLRKKQRKTLPTNYLCLKISVRKSSKDKVIKPSLSSSYFLKTSVILFKLMQLCTKRSKLIAPSPLLSYVLKRISTNWGVNLYPKATSALVYSSIWIFPLLSVSNRSKRERHAAKNPQRPQNSSKPIVPERFVSNIRIIILTV